MLWSAFGLVSIWLGWQGFVAEAVPYGDVSFVYEFWANNATHGATVVGIDTPWVYPVAALVPIMLPLVAGGGNYALGWIMLVTALNAGAFAYLLYSHRGLSRNVLQRKAAWWWLFFMVLLGPIAVARLDSIITPLAIVGLLLAIERPAVSAVLLTVATWIKVSPAALIAAVVVSVQKRMRFLFSVVISSAVISLIALILGGGGQLLSFLSQHTGRGLQIEAPLATPFMWLAAAGVPGYTVYYDAKILTYQVMGDGTQVVATFSNLLLGLFFILVMLGALWLKRRGVSPQELLPQVALTLTLVLMVFNKVGSPQYITWLAGPIILGIVAGGKSFKIAAVFSLVLAILTQGFYPYLYNELLLLQPMQVMTLSLRNIGEIALLVLSLVWLYRSRRRLS